MLHIAAKEIVKDLAQKPQINSVDKANQHYTLSTLLCNLSIIQIPADLNSRYTDTIGEFHSISQRVNSDALDLDNLRFLT